MRCGRHWSSRIQTLTSGKPRFRRSKQRSCTATITREWFVALAGGDVRIVKQSGQSQVVRWQTGKAYWLPADAPGEYHSYANDGAWLVEFMYIEFEKS